MLNEGATEHPEPATPGLGSLKDHSRYDFAFRWLASYPKSGNTWVRLFIWTYRKGYLDINGLGNQSDTSRMCWQGATNQPLHKLSETHSALVRPAAMFNLHLMFASNAIERPVVKTHSANVRVHGVPLIPMPITAPNGAIHIIRDPRDVVCSWSRHFECTLDHAIERLEDKGAAIENDGILTVMSDWSSHTESWARDWSLQIRYEDLLAEPETEFARILEHLGEPFDQARFEKALELTRIDNLRKQEDEQGFVEHRGNDKFFRKGEARQFEKELTKAQIKRIEDFHGEIMGKVGYL